MKENRGLARRQQLRQRLLIAFASSVSFFLGSHVYRILPYYETNVDLHVRLDPLDEFMRDAFSPNFDPFLRGVMGKILSASTNLINIDFGSHASLRDHSYSGIVAEFCPLNFTAQKESPIDFPMFGDVAENSHCGKGSKNIIRVDLKEAVQLARDFDEYIAKNGDRISSNVGNLPTVLDLKGVVFHESRCGSTLATNSMIALDPAKHRVYSESGPPESAMKVCGEGYSKCSVEAAASLMKDVIYMMSRSNDPKEERLFFKFQSATTRTMETFRMAFPTTPWIFLYREPIEAMMSQGKNPAFSLNPSPMVQAFVKKGGYDMEEITTREMYAVQLATFCLSALRNFRDADGLGLAVKYSSDLADDFIDTIFPKHFHTPVGRDGKERILKVSEGNSYPEDGLSPVPPGEKRSDSDAPKSMKEAVKIFLQPSYKLLEDSGYNIQKCRFFTPRGVLLQCNGLIKEKD